jgi:hypothetical protein
VRADFEAHGEEEDALWGEVGKQGGAGGLHCAPCFVFKIRDCGGEEGGHFREVWVEVLIENTVISLLVCYGDEVLGIDACPGILHTAPDLLRPAPRQTIPRCNHCGRDSVSQFVTPPLVVGFLG